MKIRMGAVDQVQQVCSIGKDRLLVFGLLGDHSAHDVLLIDTGTGVKLDEFWVRSPAVSPDQPWLALREFYPAQSEVPSEQYMLYDLTKDASGNKIPGADYPYVERLGRTMYPATTRHIPFQSSAVPPNQWHSFRGGSFVWASDSKSLVFLDSTPAGLALVLVRIGADDLSTYIHGLGADVCASTLSRADFGAAPGVSVPDVRIEFDEACPPLSIRARDFKRAPLEIHKPQPRKPTVLIEH